RSALSPLVILSTDTIRRRLEGIYNYELLLIKSVNILIAEDKLEDKPGDTIEVVIKDKPEDIPDERPLPTSKYSRPYSLLLLPTYIQIRVLGRKRKSRKDNIFEYY
ncbi:hypothetical protein N7445_008886, partial [Penicillium cf. griseofulvum]